MPGAQPHGKSNRRFYKVLPSERLTTADSTLRTSEHRALGSGTLLVLG